MVLPVYCYKFATLGKCSNIFIIPKITQKIWEQKHCKYNTIYAFIWTNSIWLCTVRKLFYIIIVKQQSHSNSLTQYTILLFCISLHAHPYTIPLKVDTFCTFNAMSFLVSKTLYNIRSANIKEREKIDITLLI